MINKLNFPRNIYQKVFPGGNKVDDPVPTFHVIFGGVIQVKVEAEQRRQAEDWEALTKSYIYGRQLLTPAQ